MQKLLPSLFLIFCSLFAKAQSVGIGTLTPHASAALEIADSAKGVLIPRLTIAQRTAISNPAEGLMVYQTDGTKGYWYFDGSEWKNVANTSNTTTGSGSGSDPKTLIYTTTGF